MLHRRSADRGALIHTHRIVLGKSLIHSFSFPIIITNPFAVNNDTRTKLTKHRPGGHQRNLAGPERMRKKIGTHEGILFLLGSDKLIEALVLIEQQIRVAIIELLCTFGRHHVQL